MAWTPPNWITLIGLNVQGDLGGMTMYTSARGKLVVFGKSPPLSPASLRQRAQRNKFVRAAKSWQSLTPESRATWELAAKRCSLKCTGYNLWTIYSTEGFTGAIETIQHQSGLTLPTS